MGESAGGLFRDLFFFLCLRFGTDRAIDDAMCCAD